jgi:hypothetical protein
MELLTFILTVINISLLIYIFLEVISSLQSDIDFLKNKHGSLYMQVQKIHDELYKLNEKYDGGYEFLEKAISDAFLAIDNIEEDIGNLDTAQHINNQIIKTLMTSFERVKPKKATKKVIKKKTAKKKVSRKKNVKS